jgi:putative transposase
MARPLRIELAGGLYHVTSRGDRQEAIYSDIEDRRLWLRLLAEVCKRYNWHCHAWCQMTNHYHIVVETVEGNLSQGMRHLNGVYTQRYNRRHERVGHVYQGRYKAVLVERDAHLLELTRYVVLNPVRAGLVKDAGEWPWSSYRATVGHAAPPFEWRETDWLLGQFGRDRYAAIRRYVDFVRAGVGLPSIWTNLKGQLYLGSERFASEMAHQISANEALDEIPKTQKRPLAQPLEYYTETIANSAEAMACAYATGQYTMKEIALHFGVHYCSVSRAVRRYGRDA